MWARLILPDCRSCDKRKAYSWRTKLCHPCQAEVELLEEILALQDQDSSG